MVTLDVLSLLEKKGKTKYWLYHQLGMSYQNFSRMVNNETKSIRYENIEALCQIFECTPNDLSASPKIKTTASAVVFCSRPAASAAMPPRTMSAAVPSSLAPHDSKARLILVTIRRDSWRSHVHRTHTAQRVQFFKRQTRNVGGRGALPSRSLGGLRGIFSHVREYPPYLAAAPSAALPLRASRG